MFLDYLALFLLCLSGTMVFYLFIYIHELPHKAALARDHPHEEAIFVACWLSLFTLHAIWPIVFIWAVSHKRRTRLAEEAAATAAASAEKAAAAAEKAAEAVAAEQAALATAQPGAPQPGANGDLAHRLAALEERLGRIESVTK